MSTNMDGPDALIEEVLELPVEDLQTFLTAVINRLRPLADSVQELAAVLSQLAEHPEAQYDVVITSCVNDKPIQTIKAVRNASACGPNKGLSLMEAKIIVDALRVNGTISVVASRLLAEEAEECIRILEREGAHAHMVPL
jgi:ribosomal protein L7/L12